MRRTRQLCVCVVTIGCCVAVLWHFWPSLSLAVHASRTDFVLVSIDGGSSGVAYWRVDGERAKTMLEVLRKESVPERYPQYAEGTIMKMYLFDAQGACIYCCPIKSHRWRIWLEKMARTGSRIAESDLGDSCDFSRHYSVVSRVFRE